MVSQFYSDLLRGVRNRCSKRKEKNVSERSAEDAARNVRAAPVIRELISSEQTYLNFLKSILDNFLTPMENQHLLTRSETQIIFGEIETIYKINTMLLEMLNTGDPANAFKQFLPCIKAYYRYAEKFERAHDLHLSKVRENKRYQKLVTSAEGDAQMKLEALLIMPIQRIPRYNLLLNNLKNTLGGSEILEIAQEMETATRQLDAHVMESKNAAEMLEVEGKLDFMNEVVVPGRKLLKSGILYEVQNRARLKRRVWLFSDVFVTAKRKVNGRFDCCLVYPIRHCEVTSDGSNFSFSVKCRDETTTLTSDSYGISQSWILVLELAISQAKACRSSLRKESSKQVPWKKRRAFTIRTKGVREQKTRRRTLESSSTNSPETEVQEQESPTLSCLSCLGIRRSRNKGARRTTQPRVLRIEKNVPWWVKESTPSGYDQ
uniref:DH domain-containing protein n=1 Tax=Steinernema glaseri TaxID=37863 RepID=A0A1I7ZTR2_9BILA